MTEYSIDRRRNDYEYRRRTRLLGLSIDQTLTGLKNIIVYSDAKFWRQEDLDKWADINQDASNILVMAIALERKLSSLANIYATMIPNNAEATTTPRELES